LLLLWRRGGVVLFAVRRLAVDLHLAHLVDELSVFVEELGQLLLATLSRELKAHARVTQRNSRYASYEGCPRDYVINKAPNGGRSKEQQMAATECMRSRLERAREGVWRVYMGTPLTEFDRRELRGGSDAVFAVTHLEGDDDRFGMETERRRELIPIDANRDFSVGNGSHWPPHCVEYGALKCRMEGKGRGRGLRAFNARRRGKKLSP
jgi:hypothetical protein